MKATVDVAAYALDALGSGNDPVWHKGVETTPLSLIGDHGESDAARFRIAYYGLRSRKLRRINGTLLGMLRDRTRS